MDVSGKTASERRLIDVNDIYSLFNQSGIARLHVSDIDTIPRVDVVEVVRCKDCKYFSEFQHCGILGFCEPDEYCSRGERRK